MIGKDDKYCSGFGIITCKYIDIKTTYFKNYVGIFIFDTFIKKIFEISDVLNI